MSANPVDATPSGRPRREDEVPLLARFVQRVSVIIFPSECGRLVAGALKDSVAELRKDEEARISRNVLANALGSADIDTAPS